MTSTAALTDTGPDTREDLDGFLATAGNRAARLRWLMDLLIEEGNRLKSELAFADSAAEDLPRLAGHFARGISLEGWTDEEVMDLVRFRLNAIVNGIRSIGDLSKNPGAFPLWGETRRSLLWQGLHERAQFFYDVGLALYDWMPPPDRVTIYLTSRCNLACKHCNQVADNDTGLFDEIRSRPEDFTRDEVFTMFEKSEILRHTRVGFSGGEVFLRKDLAEILSGLARMGVRFSMLTNGTYTRKLKELIADPDVRKGLEFINFSLDGIGDAHEAIRGKGTYALLERSLGITRDAGVPGSALAVAQATNLETIRDLKDHVAANPGDFPEFRIQLEFLDAEYWQANRRFLRPLLGPLLPEDYYLSLDPALNRSGLACPAGSAFCRIDPDTRVKACGYDFVAGEPVDLVMGYVRDHGFNFDDLWNSERAVGVRRRVKTCVGCGATCIRK